MKTDERVVIVDRQTLLPVNGQRYTAKHEDGSSVKGATDEQGRTGLVKGNAAGQVDVTVHDNPPEAGPSTEGTSHD